MIEYRSCRRYESNPHVRVWYDWELQSTQTLQLLQEEAVHSQHNCKLTTSYKKTTAVTCTSASDVYILTAAYNLFFML